MSRVVDKALDAPYVIGKLLGGALLAIWVILLLGGLVMVASERSDDLKPPAHLCTSYRAPTPRYE